MNIKNCNTKEFIERLNGRKVICFGAGSTLTMAQTEEVKIDMLEKHIAFFVDNDKKKHGLGYEYMGRTFKITSADAFEDKDFKADDYILLITNSAYADIYSQLKDIPQLKAMDCYMYELVCFEPEVDAGNFFHSEAEKYPYKEWKKILKDMNLKDKHKGERCFIIGNGPSLKTADLELLKNEVTFAANAIYLCFDETDWRPTYYFCVDHRGYGRIQDKVESIEAECRFVPYLCAIQAGEVDDKVTYYNRQYQGTCVEGGKIAMNQDFNFSDNIEEVVYQGWTVLYDALQFAVYMGFSEIYLLGVDCSFRWESQPDGTIVENEVEQNHFSSEYEKEFEKNGGFYGDFSFEATPIFAIKQAFQKAREVCAKKGIIIKNATRGGNLEVFERVTLESLLNK